MIRLKVPRIFKKRKPEKVAKLETLYKLKGFLEKLKKLTEETIPTLAADTPHTRESIEILKKQWKTTVKFIDLYTNYLKNNKKVEKKLTEQDIKEILTSYKPLKEININTKLITGMELGALKIIIAGKNTDSLIETITITHKNFEKLISKELQKAT